MSQMLNWAVAGVAAVAITLAGCATEKPTVTKPTVTKPTVTKPTVTKAAAAKAKAAKAKAAKAPAVKSVCQKIDANKDGKLTSDEHKARLGQWFKELDASRDGKLTPVNFRASGLRTLTPTKMAL